MAKNVLVTGGAGFIGGHLAASLIADGYHVDIVDNLSTGKRENIPDGADFQILDLRFPESIAELPRKDYVAILHLAGQSSGEKSFDDPVYDFDANARSTLLLTRWALENGIPAFLYAGSMGVYGQVKEPPVSEEVIPSPVSYYGASKLAAERILSVAASQGLRTVSFRMFSVYGPGQNLEEMKQGMVSIFLAQILLYKAVTVRGPLDRVRDFIYIDDVVSAWRMALEKPVAGVFNLGSGQPTRIDDLIKGLEAAYGCDRTIPVEQSAGTPGDQFAVYADISAIRRALGWEPRVFLQEGLSRIVSWGLTAPSPPSRG